MKTFRDLKLIVTISNQEKLIDLIEQQLSDGWIRDRERELKATQFKSDQIIFTCSKTDSQPIAFILFFITDKNNHLCLSNIIRQDGKENSVDDYNAILQEFTTQFIEPVTKELNIRIITTPPERTIDNTMSPEMSQVLRQFSSTANKAGIHSLDELRFFDFIIQANQEKSLLDETELSELLIDDGWSHEKAEELSSQYRFARDLLNHYGE